MRHTLFLRSTLGIANAILFLFCAHACHAFGWPGSNDEIFPPAASAQKAIHFDNRGFIINGKRTFIVAGDLHYNRIPRALWRDRILRIKRAGYNTIQTYVFWNFHESRENEFNFSGDHDLDAFLKLVRELDMYAIVRVGPYVNADADSGGLPLWLRFKPGLLPMMDNQPFYDAVEPYWRKMLPIVAMNQITHGGSVILIQLENEDTRGTGTDLPDNYYKTYLKFAQDQGLTVPMFFSGLNHGDDSAGPNPFDTSKRHSPWISSEFWTGWVAVYGVDPARGIKLDRATWRIIAYGGAGYTHYEMAGGTDFGTLHCDEDGASYDFGAPIGQAGDLRFDYYLVKRSAMFANSFPDILANSGSADNGYGASLTNSNLRLTGRQGPAGTILFLDNATGSPQTTQIKTTDGKLYPTAGPITLLPNEFVPVVQGYKLSDNLTLNLSAARILGVAHVGSVVKIVVYGAAGEPVELHFGTGTAKSIAIRQPGGLKCLEITPGHTVLKASIPAEMPDSYVFKVGPQTVQVLTETGELADRTWFVPVDNSTHIVTGPDYIGEVSSKNGRLTLHAEFHGLTIPTKTYPMLDFAPDGEHPLEIVQGGPAKSTVAGPELFAWRADSSVPQAQPNFDDSQWLPSPDPLPMGADGCEDAYAWYRSTLHAVKPGPYELYLPDSGDWATCFINGKRVDSTSVQRRYRSPVPGYLHVNLPEGDSKVAILASHYGRFKLMFYYGPLDTIDRKGIAGPIVLNNTPTHSLPLTGLRWITDSIGNGDWKLGAGPDVNTADKGWEDYTLNQDIFQGRAGNAWVDAALPDAAGAHHKIQFQSVDDNCVVYLNGQRMGDHEGVGTPFTIDLDSAWKNGGPNKLALMVQNTGGPGGIFWGLNLLTGTFGSGPAVQGWRMKGGEAPPVDTNTSWKALVPNQATGVPTWYRANFVVPTGFGPHPILRATWGGLSRGFMWLNGHNLGRYPDRANINGLYLPECWITAGNNTLEIFDEEGKSPSQMQLEVNAAESRSDMVLKE